MKIESSSEKNDGEKYANNLAVLFVESIANGFNKFSRNRGLQARRYSHDKKCQPPNPYDRRHYMEPMI